MIKPLFIEYCAKDFLDGTQMLDAWEELAYRRICDLIYATGDRLDDNDKKLAWMTKSGGVAKWRKIKASLILMGKISVVDGKVTNKTCTKKIEKSLRNIEQKRIAGLSSSEARKPLKNNNTGSTAVATANATAVITAVPTNQEPNNQVVEAGTNVPTSSARVVEPPGDVQLVAEKVAEIAGGDASKNPNWAVSGEVARWLSVGCLPALDIYPAIAEVMQSRGGQGPPGTPAYFAKAVLRARDRRLAQLNPVGETDAKRFDRDPGHASRFDAGIRQAAATVAR
tara:strand:- start:3 stop:848 length:846 start_codon:yes stop_codon:yes gene_type:complete